MKRILSSSAALLAFGVAAQAQTVTRSVTTTDGYGNSTTTTVEAPASVAGLIAGQTIYGGFPNYTNGVPSYSNSNRPMPTYGYNQNPGYGYNNGYGYNGGYGNYGGYGYGNYAGYNRCPAPAPYAYPPQAYYVPGQTTYLPPTYGSPFLPPSITSLPQVITTPGVPLYPYGAYGYPAPNYGLASRTTVTNGVISYRKNGVSVTLGGSATQTR